MHVTFGGLIEGFIAAFLFMILVVIVVGGFDRKADKTHTKE